MAKKDQTKKQYVEISRREQRLRERLLTVDEDIVRSEKRLHRNGERRKTKLAAKINQARSRQEIKLNRRDNSKLYDKAPWAFYLTTPFRTIGRGIKKLFSLAKKGVDHHKATTPHRSFYLTTHAKAVRQINISGHIRFIGEVWRFIWDNRWIYFKALLLLTAVLLSVIGLSAQANYIEIREALQEVDLGWFLETVGMTTQAVITSLTVGDANKQTFAVILVMFIWLALIYIVRRIYSGQTKFKLRDALYNSGGPFISLLAMLIVVMVEILPLAIVLISYAAVTGAGYINQGIEIENMAAWCAIAVVAILTIYWMITSLISLITVTIPGIYPLRAYFETSVLISGRRVKILFRILSMFIPLLIMWFVILVPAVILDGFIKFKTLPFIQIVTTLLVAASLIWISVYLYSLYRRLLDSPEQPAGTPNSRFVWPWLRRRRTAEINAVTETDD